MALLLIIIYTSALVFIFLYSTVQMHLVYHYLKFKRKIRRQGARQVPEIAEADLPFVTIQLPIYNEMYVIERLIDAVAAFDYPKDKFEVQVLDDSNDETLEIVAKKVEAVRKQGINIEQVIREDRVGFKAGALQYGLKSAKGEFIAIFDADFVPPSDFLQKTIPQFDTPEIGVVQTCWEHLNENYSILTKLQAFALDAHFSVEQKGRNAAGYFMNFNGTAGVWRRACIDDAGGWQADTLTEDLDLSYRAQLKGWKFFFMEEAKSPAELPAQMGAIKSQQFRWTKGAAETAKKNLWTVLKAKLPFSIKLHATFHLMNSFLFICILLTGLLSVPLLYYKNVDESLNTFFQWASVFLLSLLILIVFFWVARGSRTTLTGFPRTIRFMATFPIFLSISMGLSLHNAIATLEGYLGFKSPFIRTPKFAISNLKDTWKEKKKYLTKGLSIVTLLEGLLCLYFAGALVLGVWLQDYGLIPFHFLMFFGYGLIFYYSIRHSMA